MAKLPVSNVTVRTMADKGKTQEWVPLTDPSNGGCIVALGVRAMPCDFVADLWDAAIARGYTGAVIGHGVRLVMDPVSGRGSPCFVERKGATEGTLYVFKGLQRKDAILSALAAKGCAPSAARDESKGGLYLTFDKGCIAADVLAVLARPEFHIDTAANGYRSDMGGATRLDSGTPPDAPQIAQPTTDNAPQADDGKGSKRKVKRENA